MFAMQDPNDGGVYHKCTNASFDGMVMPGITKEPRYAVQKSTAAALILLLSWHNRPALLHRSTNSYLG
jgi:endoglucanase